MKRPRLIVRATLTATILCASVVSVGGLWPHGAGGQGSATSAPTVRVDMVPAETSAEVQARLIGSTFQPDPEEPAGAVLDYLETEDNVRTAMRRIELGLRPGEADFDPVPLLDDALAVRRRSASLYPTSRHAWMGVGQALWQTYLSQHRAADLRGAVEAYMKAAELLIPEGAGAAGAREFPSLTRDIATGLVTLSDQQTLEAFFQKLKGTELWELARDAYAVALGRLNDPRADQAFRELLALMPPDETLPDYVDYLWDQRRYQDALRVLDRKPSAALNPGQWGQRAAILERLGRLSEAQAEYRRYREDVAKAAPWPLFSLPERYRVPGSALQQGIRFLPSAGFLPKPQMQAGASAAP